MNLSFIILAVAVCLLSVVVIVLLFVKHGDNEKIESLQEKNERLFKDKDFAFYLLSIRDEDFDSYQKVLSCILLDADVDKMIRHMNDIRSVCANRQSGKQELFALKHAEELIRNVYKKQIKFK